MKAYRDMSYDENRIAVLEAELAEANKKLIKQNGINDLLHQQLTRAALCSDHRDKFHGQPCRQCLLEKAEQEVSRLKEIINGVECSGLADGLLKLVTDKEKAEQEVERLREAHIWITENYDFTAPETMVWKSQEALAQSKSGMSMSMDNISGRRADRLKALAQSEKEEGDEN